MEGEKKSKIRWIFWISSSGEFHTYANSTFEFIPRIRDFHNTVWMNIHTQSCCISWNIVNDLALASYFRVSCCIYHYYQNPSIHVNETKRQFDQIRTIIIQNDYSQWTFNEFTSLEIRMKRQWNAPLPLPLLLTVTANASYKCVLSCSFNGECRAEYTAHTTRHGGHTCRNFIVGKEATVHKRSAAAHWPRTPGSAELFSFTLSF